MGDVDVRTDADLEAEAKRQAAEQERASGGAKPGQGLDWTAAAVDRPLPAAVVAGGTAPIVPAGEVGLLCGLGGVGKSRLAIQIAVAAAGAPGGELVPVLGRVDPVASGSPFDVGSGGDVLRVRGGPVVVVGYEDDAPWVRMRARGVAQWFDGDNTDAWSAAVDRPERLSVAVTDDPLWAPGVDVSGRTLPPGPTGTWAGVFARAGEVGAKLIVVDPVMLAVDFDAEGYPAGPVGWFVSALRREAVRLGLAVVLVHHMPKSARAAVREGEGKRKLDAGDVAGSHAWVDRVRGVLMLGGGRLGVPKANYAPSGEDAGWKVRAVMVDGRPVAWEVDGDGEADRPAERRGVLR